MRNNFEHHSFFHNLDSFTPIGNADLFLSGYDFFNLPNESSRNTSISTATPDHDGRFLSLAGRTLFHPHGKPYEQGWCYPPDF
jgi:hypothetical protein